jgi:hypothetical protein
MSRLAGLGLLMAAILLRPAAASAEVELLPNVSVRLEAARYVPTEDDQRFTGWIGAGAGLVRAGSVTGYFDADAETILGWERRPFEANQVNYHLELGLHRPIGTLTLTAFFHHVSRHAVDREKPEAVDWNILGASIAGPVGGPVRMRASAGYATIASLVGYEWEFTAGLTADLTPVFYLSGDVRYVTVDPDPAYPRDDFADLRAEAGARWLRGEALLSLFAAFERRNDVMLLVPEVRDRLLLGFRIGYSGRP